MIARQPPQALSHSEAVGSGSELSDEIQQLARIGVVMGYSRTVRIPRISLLNPAHSLEQCKLFSKVGELLLTTTNLHSLCFYLNLAQQIMGKTQKGTHRVSSYMTRGQSLLHEPQFHRPSNKSIRPKVLPAVTSLPSMIL